ncbi:MAG: ribonuclease R [Fidelibacterota bacterium]
MKGRILKFLKDHPGMAYRKRHLGRQLGVTRAGYREFRAALRELERGGEVFRIRGGEYIWVDPADRRRGKLVLHQKGFGFLQVEEGEDIFIHSRNLGGAVNGDTVEVAPFPSPFGSGTEGRVIRIIERGTEEFIGTVTLRDDAFYLQIDPATPRRGIRIVVPSPEAFSPRDVVVARVEDWGDRRRPIRVKVVEVIGNIGDATDDMKIVCHKFDLDPRFPPRVLSELERVREKAIEADLENRTDLRGKRCITIDPADARDFDDALSLERDDRGRPVVGVHIADVSFLVPQGTEIDKEARRRGTSVYFAEGTVHMLPEKLSAHLCSLVPGEDRLTISVLMALTPGGEVEEVTIVPSVIRVSRRFTYREVQAILDGKRQSRYSPLLTEMRDIGRLLLSRRERKGSIDFDIPEPIFRFRNGAIPHEIHPSERLDSHRIVEEFMLLANRVIARRVPRSSPEGKVLPFVYRVHPEPPAKDVERFLDLLSRFKLITGVPSKTDSWTFRKVLADLEDSPFRGLIENLALRTMTKAIYSVENMGHYGLAFDTYCHFTSPIRRYPDLVVHRMVRNYLFHPHGPSRLPKVGLLRAIARESTELEIRAMEAERDYIKLKQLRWLNQHLGEHYEGIISGVVSSGIFVELEDALVEGFVPVDTMEDDYYSYDEKELALVGKRGRESYHLGKTVTVRVHDVNLESRQANFRLVV